MAPGLVAISMWRAVVGVARAIRKPVSGPGPVATVSLAVAAGGSARITMAKAGVLTAVAVQAAIRLAVAALGRRAW